MRNKYYQAKITITADENIIDDIQNNLNFYKEDIDYYVVKPLTKREAEVLELIILGKNDIEISEILNISLNTVKAHVKNIFKKLYAHDRVQAAVRAIKENLL